MPAAAHYPPITKYACIQVNPCILGAGGGCQCSPYQYDHITGAPSVHSQVKHAMHDAVGYQGSLPVQ